jgi:hypothetical protein
LDKNQHSELKPSEKEKTLISKWADKMGKPWFPNIGKNWKSDFQISEKIGNPDFQISEKIGNPDCRPLPEPEQEAGVGAGDWADPHPGGQLVQEPPPARQSGSRQEQVINTMEEWNV